MPAANPNFDSEIDKYLSQQRETQRDLFVDGEAIRMRRGTRATGVICALNACKCIGNKVEIICPMRCRSF
ncbi:hypothetical protein RP20_CCG022926 [Aedes albopictus]|nr:hypothetical protein RP20_CCG022926 [Aedes albopictus]